MQRSAIVLAPSAAITSPAVVRDSLDRVVAVDPHVSRSFLFIRVSSQDQAIEGMSLEAQQEGGIGASRARGYGEPFIFIEVESAGGEKLHRRSEMHRLTDILRPGDRLICRDLGRWSRDNIHSIQSVRDLRSKGITVHFYTQPFLDETHGGADLLGLFAWLYELDRTQRRELTTGNRRRLRRHGAFVEGLPPLGYTVQERKLVVVEDHAAIVRKMAALCMVGVPVRKILEWLQAEHPALSIQGKKKVRVIHWTANTIHRILTNRLYTGYTATAAVGARSKRGLENGDWQPTHEAIISVADFERVQQALETRRRGGGVQIKGLTNSFLLKHVAVCEECGYRVRAFADPRVKKGTGGYYVCAKRADPKKYPGGEKCPNAVCADWQIADKSAEAQTLARLEELAEILSTARPEPEEVRPDFEKQLEEQRAERANYIRLAGKRIISDEDLSRQLGELDRRSARIEAARAEWEARQMRHTDDARKEAFAKLKDYREVWERLEASDRRDLLNELAARVTIDRSATVQIEWRPIGALLGPQTTPKKKSPSMALAA